MLGLSAPMQVGQPGSNPLVNVAYVQDSRDEKPSTWDEVCLLQEAMKPSIRSFTYVTSRTPKFDPETIWRSYAEQIEILQSESDRYWNADHRSGDPPILVRLDEWRGGILMIDKAGFLITEDTIKEFKHPALGRKRHRVNSPGCYQDTFGEQAHNEVKRILSAADARSERSRAQAVEGEEQQDVSGNTVESLDRIVARDPERYLAWLSTMGYFYFTMKDHNPYGFSWEDWCKWQAPRSFGSCCKQHVVVRRPPLGPGAIARTKYGQSGDRPTITLDEAKKGNRRAMEFRDTGNGMEVSMKEKSQYYMVDGEATSREAAAHYHVIRGEDVWLFEPEKSSKELYDDLSRQREAEVEASFCHQQP